MRVLVINNRLILMSIHFVFLVLLINIDTIHASLLPGIYEGDARTPLIFITLLTTIPFIATNKLIDMKINYIIIFLIIFLIYTFINYILLSQAPTYGFQKLQGLLLGAFLGFLLPIFMKYNFKDLRLFLYILLILDLIIALLMIYINDIPHSGDFGRLSFGELNTIWLARFYGEIILLSTLLFKNRFIKTLLITIFLVGMILTGSKGPIISLGVVILFIYVLRGKRKLTLKQLYKLPLLILCILGGIYLVLKVVIVKITDIEFLMYRFNIIASESSYTEGGRLGLIKLAFSYFKENPVFGSGLGSYGYFKTGMDMRAYPHNLFIETLIELGLIGFFMLLTIMILFIMKLYKIRYTKMILSTYFTVFLSLGLFYFINSMMSGDMGTSNYYLYIYMGFLNYVTLKNVTINLN